MLTRVCKFYENELHAICFSIWSQSLSSLHLFPFSYLLPLVVLIIAKPTPLYISDLFMVTYDHDCYNNACYITCYSTIDAIVSTTVLQEKNSRSDYTFDISSNLSSVGSVKLLPELKLCLLRCKMLQNCLKTWRDHLFLFYRWTLFSPSAYTILLQAEQNYCLSWWYTRISLCFIFDWELCRTVTLRWNGTLGWIWADTRTLTLGRYISNTPFSVSKICSASYTYLRRIIK